MWTNYSNVANKCQEELLNVKTDAFNAAFYLETIHRCLTQAELPSRTTKKADRNCLLSRLASHFIKPVSTCHDSRMDNPKQLKR